MITKIYKPKWIGHRGWPERYPENSIEGLKAALERGAEGIEVDVQFTKDRQPVICHDTDLERVSGKTSEISTLNKQDLLNVSVHEPSRFQEKFLPTQIPDLDDLKSLMQTYPKRYAFIELKSEVFEHTSRESALEILFKSLNPMPCPWVFIAYDFEVLNLAKQKFGWSIGWVLTRFDEESQAQASNANLDFLICNIQKVPLDTKDLWQGPWEWFIYDITSEEAFSRCKKLNVQWLETWNIGWQ